MLCSSQFFYSHSSKNSIYLATVTLAESKMHQNPFSLSATRWAVKAQTSHSYFLIAFLNSWFLHSKQGALTKHEITLWPARHGLHSETETACVKHGVDETGLILLVCMSRCPSCLIDHHTCKPYTYIDQISYQNINDYISLIYMLDCWIPALNQVRQE